MDDSKSRSRNGNAHQRSTPTVNLPVEEIAISRLFGVTSNFNAQMDINLPHIKSRYWKLANATT
jgi:hypothetical protein